MTERSRPPAGRRQGWRFLPLLVLSVPLSLVLVWSLLASAAPVERLEAGLEAIGPLAAPVAFAALYAAAVVLMIPGSALTLVAGAYFGPGLGMLAVSVGANVGASLAFLIARYLARDAVAARLERYPRFAAIDRAIGQGGWKIVALLRLSPAVPFNVQNYLYGLTRIRFWPCALASLAAMLPGTWLYISVGHAARAGLEAAAGGQGAGRSPGQWAMIGVGLAATLVVTLYITRLARKEMGRIEEEIGNESPPTQPS